MVTFSSTEIIIALFLIIAFAVAYFYLIDFNVQNKAVTLNFTKGVKNIVRVVNSSSSVSNSSINVSNISNISIAKTISTTTSTIKIMFFNTPGIMTSVIKSGTDNILINCGTNISVADKLFINGAMPLKATVITKMDYDHIGICGRVLMIAPPAIVLDAGSVGSGFSNYEFVVGGKRKPINQGFKFSIGKINGVVVKSVSGTNTIEFKYRNISYVYADGCDSVCLKTVLGNNRSVDMLALSNGMIDEDMMSSIVPSFVAVNNVSQETIDLAHKYGVKIVDVSKSGDFSVVINDKGVDWNVASGF